MERAAASAGTASVDRELRVEARDVGLDGVLRDEEVGRDVGVRRAAGQLVEHVVLARAQRRPDRARGAVLALARVATSSGRSTSRCRTGRRCRPRPRAATGRRWCRRGAGPARTPACRAGSSPGTARRSCAPWSRARPRPSRRRARSPSPSASTSWAWATSASPRTAGCAVAGPLAASSRCRTAARRSPAKSARRPATSADSAAAPISASWLWSWPTVAPSPERLARKARSSSSDDREVRGQRRRLEGHLERELGGRTPSHAASWRRDRRVRIQKRVVRSAAWPASGSSSPAPSSLRSGSPLSWAS